MTDSFLRNGPRLAARFACAGLMGVLLAGCSSDATRFSDAFSNPFASRSDDQQPQRTAQAAPVHKVQAQPLPAPVQTSALPASAETTSAIGPQGGSAAGWTAAGGSPIVVGQGESVNVLSQRYGVPTAALLQVNGFSSATQVKPGTRLVIPVYNAGASAPAPRVAATVAAPKVAVTEPRVAVAAPKVAVAEPRVAVAAPKVAIKVAAPAAQVRPGVAVAKAHVVAPAPAVNTRIAVAAPKVAVKTPAVAVPVVAVRTQAPAAVVKTPRVAVAQPQVGVRVAAPAAVAAAQPQPAAPSADTTAAIKPVPAASAQGTDESKPEFRMPAPGRVIEGFKAGSNDGINIAVPEGTPVKAAEAGTVIYAGSELKGYGNLVLIRHPNGYTTAYANNGELDVKRGDTVKRGQMIAKSGQTGNVASPQLHFELRKGSQPVDPSGYIAGM
ncbi:peptidoglycan DD-metalloendopeptidase family protein [Methylovirgula sp. 4M-Z18]|uniref:peptidoglycan DD-metalloendopeptidase family protein n=1 Tax=Methylovirgula sp. 4M-Z18 TaxID=2293567 RepID=UPI000E2E5019|nr:peptidoglycan DD-metalloendopeptidase family protein [Methylovirgula sp. 4M-Z18]RFB81029.1 LysM peptidoglycan-binding domain-containing protein [Methylovirgula sp. 4M-Z18]